MPPLGTQAFRNLRRPASRCGPEGGGPRRAGLGRRRDLALPALETETSGLPLHFQLLWASRPGSKELWLLLKSTWGDGGWRKGAMVVCKERGPLPLLPAAKVSTLGTLRCPFRLPEQQGRLLAGPKTTRGEAVSPGSGGVGVQIQVGSTTTLTASTCVPRTTGSTAFLPPLSLVNTGRSFFQGHIHSIHVSSHPICTKNPLGILKL